MEDWKAQYEKVLGRAGISGFNVAEAELRLAAREASPDTPRAPRYIVGVRFYRGSYVHGQTYSYFCDHEVHVGDHAIVRTTEALHVVKVTVVKELATAENLGEIITNSPAVKFIICVVTEKDVDYSVLRHQEMVAARSGRMALVTATGAIIQKTMRKSRKGEKQTARQDEHLLSHEELFSSDIPF